ncbi:MAG TPA: hypothetical protein VMX54_02395 [Vicinamibacteria bacterium]|nr:hypothetical protein [Vicinamibacteria bacterium]
MSLILDALRKVERERDDPEQVVVVGSIPWQGVRRSRRWRWLAGLLVLAVVATAGWWAVATGRSGRRPGLAATRTPAPAPSATPTAAPGPATTATAAPPSRPRRPTRPPASAQPATQPPDLRLMAISSQQGRPVAVISGRVVHEGDLFDDVRVVRIGEAEVEVEVRGHRRVLRF